MDRRKRATNSDPTKSADCGCDTKPATPSSQSPDFSRMSQAEKLAYNKAKRDQIFRLIDKFQPDHRPDQDRQQAHAQNVNGSRKNMIPTTAVPTAPMPVQTA